MSVAPTTDLFQSACIVIKKIKFKKIMTQLIIVRHGETIENKKGVCQGHNEGTLTENGKEQNKILANQLKNFKIDAIISSPLQRAFDTALSIQSFHKHLEIIKDKRLIERNMGVLQGNPFPENYNLFDDYEGMESINDIALRTKSFLDDFISEYKDKTILIVSHGITIKVMTSIIKNITLYKTTEFEVIKNSTYQIITI